MNIRRILISEQEKKSILGLYGVLSEQTYKLSPDGTYTVKSNPKFKSTGELQKGYQSEVIIKTGTTIKPIGNGILTFDLYYEDKGIYGNINQIKSPINNFPNPLDPKGEIKKLNKTGFYRCGLKKIGIGDMNTQWYIETPNNGFLNTIDSLFCNVKVTKKVGCLGKDEVMIKKGFKKTDLEGHYQMEDKPKQFELYDFPCTEDNRLHYFYRLIKQEPKKEKPKKIKLPNLTEKNFCNLPGDTNWDYARIDDGTWYTRRKGQEDWIKLETHKFQGAINLLEKDSKCGSLEKIPQTEIIPIDKLPTKPIEQIATKTPEIQLSPNQKLQQNLNTSTKGLNYLQGQKNKGI